MSEITSNAKSKIAIGPVSSATTVSALAALTYVAINGVEDMGEAGSSAEIITAKMIGDTPYQRKRKGSRDNGTMSLVVFYNAEDAGQIALKAAEKADDPYAFKVTLNDAPAGGTPTTFYFRGIVASAKNSFAGADDLVKTTFEIAIDGEFFEVPADA